MILYKTEIINCMQSDNKKIEIVSTDNRYPFDPDSQISDVSVDLRLGEKGYILSEEINMINSLSEKGFEELFIEHSITETGYILEPGQIIFCPTLEIVKIQDRNLLGFLCGRITYARMGLSVTCDQVKVPFGYKSVIGLQIKNNTKVPIKIYSRQKIAQIMFMQVMKANGPYNGPYANQTEYGFPTITKKECAPYSEKEWSNIQKTQSRRTHLVSKQISKRYELLKKYHKVKLSVWMACLTGTITGIVLPYNLNPKGYDKETFYKVVVIVGIIMLIMVSVDLIIDYVIFTKKIKVEEE